MDIKQVLRQFVVPPGYQEPPPGPGPIALQFQVIRRVWTGDGDGRSIGLERLLRLGLAASVFLFPSLYIRELYGRGGVVARKLGSDLLVAAKMVLPLVLLAARVEGAIAVFVVGWLLLETIVYVAGNLILADVYGTAFSDRRTFLLLLMNYWEITFSFAYLYDNLGVISRPPTGCENPSAFVAALYFSTVVSTTLGFGDIVPRTDTGRVVLTLHVWTVAIVVMTVLGSVVGDLRRRA